MNNSVQTMTAVDPLLYIDEISARTGHSPRSIRQLRVVGHELYSLARRRGNRLVLEASVVDDWVQRHRKTTAGRLQAKQRKQNKSLSESLERLVDEDDQLSLEGGFDAIRHQSWCVNTNCRGCRGQGW